LVFKNKISQIVTLQLAVFLLLFTVFSQSSSLHGVSAPVPTSKTAKSNSKSPENKATYTAANVEAVVSAIHTDTGIDAVVFSSSFFQKYSFKPVFWPNSFLYRAVFFEILFEHLVAPNAP
jgi:hypothetical protein